MRLLKRRSAGGFSLTNDIIDEKKIPSYAILSHTWEEDEEVTFQELTDGVGKGKSGYEKIRFCGEQAERDGLQYFWVDTCCINRTNNTELSEAINSMFRWYRAATRCYVYLSDVSSPEVGTHDQPSERSWEAAFGKSRWFTRGWTLQELIAPRSVEFFCANRKRLGDKKSLEGQLQDITGITTSAFRGTPLNEFSADERMSWAQDRETKREEDKVYSLLGIFDISMPIIYGEGMDNAFRRLKREIRYQLDEQSTTMTLLPSRSYSDSSIRNRDSIYPEGSADNDKSLCGLQYGDLPSLVASGKRSSMQPPRRRTIVPVTRNPRFTGRDAILETLCLMTSGCIGVQSRIALIGMGGVGKTEIAKAFMNCPMATTTFSAVLWVFAQSRTQTIQSFSKLAAALGLDQPPTTVNAVTATPADLSDAKEVPRDVSAVLNWLSEEQNQDWLLVIDNLDDLESFDIHEFLPDVSFGCIIFTSRRRSAARLGQSVDVGVMSDSEAIEMLHRCSGRKDTAQNGVAAMQLTEALGNLPLALDQAAAYIAAQDSTYDHYSDLLRDGQAELLSHKLPKAVWPYEHTVYTTWQMSMLQIMRQDPLAAELLQIAALFPANDVPLELMCQNAQQMVPHDGCFLSGFFEFVSADGNYDAILGPLPQQFHRTRHSFAAAIGLLISFSLLSRTAASNTFSVHPLVHTWLNHRIDSSGTRNHYIHSAVGLMNRAIFWSCNTGNLKHTQLLYPQLFNINRLLESAPQLLEIIDVTRLAGCLIVVDAWATLSVDWITLRSVDDFFAMLQRVQSVGNWQVPEELWLLRAICRCRAQGRQEESARLCEELFRRPPDTSRYQSMYRCCIALTYAPFLYRRLEYDQARHILHAHCITDSDRTGFLLARKDLVLGSIELDDGNLDRAESFLHSCKNGLHRHVGQDYFLLAVWYQRMGFCLLMQKRIHEGELLIWSLLQHKINSLDANRQFFAFCDYELLEVYARCLRAQKRFDEIQHLIQSVLQKTLILKPPLQRALGELSLQITMLESMCNPSEGKEDQSATFNETLFASMLEEARLTHQRSLKAFEQEWKRGFWIFQDFEKVVDKLLLLSKIGHSASS